MSTAKPFHLRNPGEAATSSMGDENYRRNWSNGQVGRIDKRQTDLREFALTCSAEAKLTLLHGPSIVRKSRSRGIVDEDSGDWQRTRTRAALRSSAERKRSGLTFRMADNPAKNEEKRVYREPILKRYFRMAHHSG